MTDILHRRAFLAGLAASAGWASLAEARRGRGGRDHERARRALREGEVRPLTEILRQVRARFGGEVIEVELERKHGGYIYEIKLLTAGRLLELEVDAATGAVLEVDDN